MKRIHALAALPLAVLLTLGSGSALAQSDPATAVRDWSKIDTNRDNLISPEEMKAYLEAEWRAARR
jgi:hypothetical protein